MTNLTKLYFGDVYFYRIFFPEHPEDTYIGHTKNVRMRMALHRATSNTRAGLKIQERDRKFEYEILEVMWCETSFGACFREQYWINTLDPNLNVNRAFPLSKKEHKERVKEFNREYKIKNRERAKQKRREYIERAGVKERIKQKKREWAIKNSERLAENARHWRANNKERIRQYTNNNSERYAENARRWRANNKDKYRELNRKRYAKT